MADRPPAGEPPAGKPPASPGMPRWLVLALAGKLVLVTLIVIAIVWYANR